jgi:hypothetical protein
MVLSCMLLADRGYDDRQYRLKLFSNFLYGVVHLNRSQREAHTSEMAPTGPNRSRDHFYCAQSYA